MPALKKDQSARSAPGQQPLLLLLLLLSISQPVSCEPANHNPGVSEPQDGKAAATAPNSAPTTAPAKLVDTQVPPTPLSDEQRANSAAHQDAKHIAHAKETHEAESESSSREKAPADSTKHHSKEDKPGTDATPTIATHGQINSDLKATDDRPSNSSMDETDGREKPVEPVPVLQPLCDALCLNGGRCIVLSTGEMVCECPIAFFGSRCQHRDICKSIKAENLNGDQICEAIGRKCLQDDKLFRCSCDKDEFFVFKADYQPSQSSFKATDQSHHTMRQQTSTFAYDSLLPLELAPSKTRASSGGESGTEQQRFVKSNSFATSTANNNKINLKDGNANKHLVDEPPGGKQTYLAECRKIDRCLHVRCRQTSEVCQDGACVCNRNAGYIQDPVDKLCKLLDPCQMATPDGLPICGQAKCVATYDRELHKCICPIGYKPVQRTDKRSSIQCAILSNQLCDIPLLNNCQHLCKIDNIANTYKCSCLPGYKPGKRAGIDDNMCFFDEHLSQPDSDDYEDYPDGRIIDRIKTDDEPRPRMARSAADSARDDGVFAYDPSPEGRGRANTEATSYRYKPVRAGTESKSDGAPGNLAKRRRDLMIKREPVEEESSNMPSARHGTTKRSSKPDLSKSVDDEDETDYDHYGELSNLSAQDRCNMYCEPNKICVLEEGSHDSYRCVCDRQGYVSVGDKCLDWCSAAEFKHEVQSLVAEVCYTGICKQADKRPPSSTSGYYLKSALDKLANPTDRERLSALVKSSWRPSFECDCSTSPLMFKDPQTKLCKLDFDAILRPCLPGNEGYTDCVINKHSYCSVLYRPIQLFLRDLFAEQISENQLKGGANMAANGAGNLSSSASDQMTAQQKSVLKKIRPKEKLYTCVCSPEKKFLVDKPRNKARCIDECDLLNNECGRFNRMCRPATIESNQDFGFMWNLIKFAHDGVRMSQFKRTGCECLPGFNVGPTESRDFTLDDNYPDNNGSELGTWPPALEVPIKDEQSNRRQVIDAYEIFQEPALSGGVNALLSANLAGPEFERLRTKYININSRCLLDNDVVEFHASFKAPASFEPSWIEVRNTRPLITSGTAAKLKLSNESEKQTGRPFEGAASKPDVLKIPAFMRADISEFYRHAVLIAQCDSLLGELSFEAYRKCLRYRYWVVQKLRRHFADWRRVITRNLKETFDLMDGNIRFRVNKCKATIKRIATIPRAFSEAIDKVGEFPDFTALREAMEKSDAKPDSDHDKEVTSTSGPSSDTSSDLYLEVLATEFDPLDPFAKIDADLDCELTIHSASDDSGVRQHERKVYLEKQLPKFIFANEDVKPDYYLMAPNALIQRESFDQLGQHRKLFSPCKSDYAYCDKQTRCEMVDTVNFSCTCDYGYTPIGSRDIYLGDSRKEVCEDIDECLFDVCKENGLENKSVCVNEIGDYKCRCLPYHVGDNKRHCNHICNVIACKYGDCRIPEEHHAFCECHEGYREPDCSVLDPSVALRKANMIIYGSIFTSVLLLAVTLAISLNSQLKKTKKKLKRLEAAQDAAEFLQFNLQQAPFTRQRVSKASIAS